MAIDTIYGLHTASDPDTILYVGRTNNKDRRIKEHLYDASKAITVKGKVLATLFEDGETIEMTVLEEVKANTPHSREFYWIEKMQQDGHPLTNQKDGDLQAYLISFEGHTRRDWSVDDFHMADWLLDEPRTKKGEKTAYLMGVQMCRKGSNLRFIHPQYREVIVEASGDIDVKFAKAIKMLTPGTDENAFMVLQGEQSLRMKPKVFE